MFATLLLDDGTVMEGEGFGHPGVVFGEAVFNTGMVGYTETLTDPSYGGQILSITYPLVGNYGVPDPAETDPDGIPAHFESSRIQVRGLAVHDLSYTASHWNLAMTLDEWMYSQGIPGIAGVDTRSLTKRLRSQGVQMSALAVSESPRGFQGAGREAGLGRPVRRRTAGGRRLGCRPLRVRPGA